MALIFGSKQWISILLFAGVVSAIVAEKVLSSQVGNLNPTEIEDQLQVLTCLRLVRRVILTSDVLQQCSLVQDLNFYRRMNAPQTSSFTAQIFEVLFPYGPAINALLATLYISGPPSKVPFIL